MTEMSTLLYRQKSLDQVQEWLCSDVTDACSRRTPPLPKVGGWGGGLERVAGVAVARGGLARPQQAPPGPRLAARQACLLAAPQQPQHPQHLQLQLQHPRLQGARLQLHRQGAPISQRASAAEPAPLAPQDREPGPAHEPLPEDELGTRDMMRRLSASGVNGKMFSTESFKQQMAALGEEGEDEESAAGAAEEGDVAEGGSGKEEL